MPSTSAMNRLAVILLAAASAVAADLPVREVTLYKHGVGYFERLGQLGPGESAHLDFKAVEMNDVLKSLTLQSNGEKITGLRYDSSEPLDVKLAEYPFAIGGGNPALSAFLNELKGARIELRFGNETVSGEIMNARVLPPADKLPEREQIVLLLDSGDLRTLDLSAATQIHFPDIKLQAQLRDYLRVVAAARSKEKRSIYIDSVDSGSRQVAARYMVPTPIWKSSYRLVFKDTGEPNLEGWAIVDNTTGEDWDKVKLSLVSGRPISFISSLYEPRYLQRVTADIKEYEGTAPVVYEGSIGANANANANANAGSGGGTALRGVGDYAAAETGMPRDRFGRTDGEHLSAAAPVANKSIEVSGLEQFGKLQSQHNLSQSPGQSSITMSAGGSSVGELFEYSFSTPVTVKKSESAMLPFLQQNIVARKLLIYSDPNAKNPMNAAEITNNTGKTLDGGPITVFDSNAYAGEALVETVKTGDKRLISYAIDLGTRLTTKFDSEAQTLSEVHVKRGYITSRYAARETRTYTIQNVDQKPKTLIIEHNKRPDYKVVNQKPIETTSTAYRFEVKLGAGATERYPVTEDHEYSNSAQISNVNDQILGFYVQNKVVPESARMQIAHILDLKRQIATNAEETTNTTNELNRLIQDQNRIRQNIQSLNQVSGQQEQVQKYARALATQEAELAALRDKGNELTRTKTRLTAELNTSFETMDF